jgi:hypothetical protein
VEYFFLSNDIGRGCRVAATVVVAAAVLVARAGVGVAVALGVNMTPDATAASAPHIVWMG